MNWTMEPPTQPGTYWFRRDAPSRDIMVQVRETNGELTVWWSDKDQTSGEAQSPLARADPTINWTGKPVDNHIVLIVLR